MTTDTVSSQAKTLLLLGLWNLDGLAKPVKKSDALELVKKKEEKMANYDILIEQLEQAAAIVRSPQGSPVKHLSLTEQGVAMLGQGLQDEAFKFDGVVVRAKTANALLRWMHTMGGGVAGHNEPVTQIDSYEAFKTIALVTFDKLNRDFNLDNLVPIYRIRREIGERVARSDFDQWLLKMQTDKALRLQNETVEDASPDKLEDSITTSTGALRCYAKRL
jgi:hypothetical protein